MNQWKFLYKYIVWYFNFFYLSFTLILKHDHGINIINSCQPNLLKWLKFGPNYICSVACVKGKYPRELLKQWDIFHEEKESQNDRPGLYSKDSYVIAMQDNTLADMAGFKHEDYFTFYFEIICMEQKDHKFWEVDIIYSKAQ